MNHYTDEALRSLLDELKELVKEAALLIKLERESRFPGTKEKE